MTEPRVVVAHREHLWWLLAEAVLRYQLFGDLGLALPRRQVPAGVHASHLLAGGHAPAHARHGPGRPRFGMPVLTEFISDHA